jgi:uncharacterized protein YraI
MWPVVYIGLSLHVGDSSEKGKLRAMNRITIVLIPALALLAACDTNKTDDSSSVAEGAVGAVADLAPGSYAVTTGDLNLRSGPGTSYDILTVLPMGTEVLVHQRSGRWYSVDALSMSGWASGRYLKASDHDAGTDSADAASGNDADTSPDAGQGGTCESWMGSSGYNCSPDGNERGMCSNGSPIVESCARGCLRTSSNDVCLGAPGDDTLSCGGSWGTHKATDGDYYMTAFGCWVDASGGVHTDPGDNCVPSCLSQAKAAGLCNSGGSGAACEEAVTWYTADGGRFGCLTRLRITNPANGKSVIGVVLDFGPACHVERSAGKEVLDSSGRINRYLFGADNGWSDRASVHVVEVDSSTPLGPVQ